MEGPGPGRPSCLKGLRRLGARLVLSVSARARALNWSPASPTTLAFSGISRARFKLSCGEGRAFALVDSARAF